MVFRVLGSTVIPRIIIYGVAEGCDAIDQIVSDFLTKDHPVVGNGRPGRGIVPGVDAGWRSRILSHRGFVLADG